MSQDFSQTADEQVKLIEQLLAVGTGLFSCQDLEELLNLILSKSRELTWSDAGSIYLLDRSDRVSKLLFMVAQNASQPNLSLREFAMPMTRESLAGYVAITGESLNCADVYQLPPGVPYKFERNFDEDISYKTRSVLLLPMRNSEGDTTGVLQLINRKIRPDTVVTIDNVQETTQPFSAWEQRIVSLLASQAAIAIERNQLRQSIDTLFEDLESAGERLSPESVPRCIYGIVQGKQAFLASNVLEGKTQILISEEQVWTIGRDRNSAIPAQNDRLSRHHAAIRYLDGKGFYLVDLKSTNGSFVNSRPVRQPILLKDRDRLRLGGIGFTFFISYGDRAIERIPADIMEQIQTADTELKST